MILEDLIQDDRLASILNGKKIGCYIGSFDPLHKGHEAVIQKILEKNLCDYILIYPIWGNDVYKTRTDVYIRLKMLYEIFADHSKVIVTKLAPKEMQDILMKESISDRELGQSVLRSKIPNAEYIGILGSDSAIETAVDPQKFSIFMKGIKVSEKHKYDIIGCLTCLSADKFIVAYRNRDNINILNDKIGDGSIIAFIETDYKDLSSTKIRNLVQSKENIDSLVSKEVCDIINSNKLYHN